MFPAVKKTLPFFGIALLLFIIFLPGYTKLQELREKNRVISSKIKKLKIENVLIEQEIKKIESDGIYQEKIARDKMGVVRKGEIPIKIITEQQ